MVAEHAEEFVAHATAGEPVAAPRDGAIHKLEMQLRKHKEKITDQRDQSQTYSGRVDGRTHRLCRA